MGWGGSVHCALLIGFWLAFWCTFIGIANRTRTVFAFFFILQSCKHQVGRIERLYLCLVQQKTLQALQGSASNKIPNIPMCTLPPSPFTSPCFPICWGSGSKTKPSRCHAYCLIARTYPSSIAGSLQSVSQNLMSPAKNAAGPTLDLWD